MTKSNYFNDAPIDIPDDDKFGINPFARAIARSIRDINSPVGVTIALNGAWGSGKSSAANLIRHYLKPALTAGDLEIIDFKCWWFRGEEALTLAFLQDLHAALGKTLGEKSKDLIPKLGKTLLRAGPVVGPAINIATGGVWGAITGGSMDFAKSFFADGESIESLFRQLSETLESKDKRFLVVIDDIDRLTPDEALLVFRLVKSVGRLPNVMYLLAFDRELAEKAVKVRYPSEGPHFLEKIIQASFDLPLPPRDDLNNAVLSQIEALCGSPKDHDQLLRFMNIFYDVVSPYMNTPRDLTRLSNSMAVSWPAVANEVDIGDYVAVEVIKLFEPALYNVIRASKDRLCGTESNYGSSEDQEDGIQKFLAHASDDRKEQAKSALQRLFPRLQNMGYSQSFLQTWEVQRLVCTEKHFDTYFRMSIGDETLPVDEIAQFIERCGDKEYVKLTFREALSSIRKSGKSKVPLLFDETTVNALRVDKGKFQSLISAIFEIADEIDRKEDEERGSFSVGSNHLRIHWLIRRLTFERCELSERSEIFLEACKDAQLGWLVDFTRSAVSDHMSREGEEPEPPEKCLVSEDRLAELKANTLKQIANAADSGQLIAHPRIIYILYSWRDIAEDDGVAVKTWTDSQLVNDTAVAFFAKGLTGESWSQGMGGMGSLGDRVAMRHTTASVDSLDSIMNVELFRQRLEELESRSDSESFSKEDITTFLEAWRQKDKGKDW